MQIIIIIIIFFLFLMFVFLLVLLVFTFCEIFPTVETQPCVYTPSLPTAIIRDVVLRVVCLLVFNETINPTVFIISYNLHQNHLVFSVLFFFN